MIDRETTKLLQTFRGDLLSVLLANDSREMTFDALCMSMARRLNPVQQCVAVIDPTCHDAAGHSQSSQSLSDITRM